MPYRLGYTPSFSSKKLVSPQGFEPRTHGLEGRCSIQLSYEPTFSMERVMRIELTLSAWKAEVLPLNYIRIKLERKTRFELATLALARRCSTPEPLPHNVGGGEWIRTTESLANGFTVRPLWPLGHSSEFWNNARRHSTILNCWSWWRESNPQPADYKSAALPLSHTSILFNLLVTCFKKVGDLERARTVDLQRDRLAF